MQMPTPCSGTVTIHRDNAMTCTNPDCPRHVTRDTWFGLHSNFLSCAAVHGPRGCSDCEFDSVVVDMAKWRHARRRAHPSMQDQVAPSAW